MCPHLAGDSEHRNAILQTLKPSVNMSPPVGPYNTQKRLADIIGL